MCCLPILFWILILTIKAETDTSSTAVPSTITSNVQTMTSLDQFCDDHSHLLKLCDNLRVFGVKEDLHGLELLREEDLYPFYPLLEARRVAIAAHKPSVFHCGDGVLQTPQEECDDGNLLNGDGCSISCLVEVEVSALELVQLWSELFHDKMRQRPIFLVTLGPPGSGKTNIVTKLMRNRVWKLENFAEFIQDNMLSKIKPYKKSMALLQSKRSVMQSEEFMSASQAIYAKYRPIIRHMRKMLLDIALREGLNIVFETTGGGKSVDDMLVVLAAAREKGYYVEVVYPYVHSDVLHSRVEKRNKKLVRTVPLDEMHHIETKSLANIMRFVAVANALTVFDNNLAMDEPLTPLFKKFIPVGALETEDVHSDNLVDVIKKTRSDSRFYCRTEVLLKPEFRPLYDSVRSLCPVTVTDPEQQVLLDFQ